MFAKVFTGGMKYQKKIVPLPLRAVIVWGSVSYFMLKNKFIVTC